LVCTGPACDCPEDCFSCVLESAPAR
jgi:hypothetical protein